MKLLVKDILISMFMGLILPGILLNYGAALLRQQAVPVAEPTETIHSETIALDVKLRKEDGVVAVMDMDTYLDGVILAEMPVWFEKEALKAQAVVARTYARKALVTGGKHGDGSVCSVPSCCQGYQNPEDYTGDPESLEKVKNAVRTTSGYVLTYEGDLIEATYFSCSGGTTEDAVAVWGREFPYLQSVESPGEENAAYYRDSLEFTRAELENLLGITLNGTPGNWIGDVTLTEGGGVSCIKVGGAEFTGVRLRQLLGLRSTAFDVEPGEDGLVFTTRGYGHRVGMSQYGADAMAASGSTFEEILTHYYQNTRLIRLKGDEES